MFYRETGDFKTSYAADLQTFPIRLDRYRYYVVMVIAIAIVPFLINDYWEKSVFIPFFVWSIAAIGLNILTGYCGQVSLGTGGFMAVGAYACYKLMTGIPDLNIFFVIILAGFITAAVGMIFGIPSLRIKGFYLAVATLAAQFFLVWLFNKVPWFYNYSASGQITAPERTVFGIAVTGPEAPPSGHLSLLPGVRRSSSLGPRGIMTRGALGRRMDGDPRHGHRGRDHRREPDEGEAFGLRRLARSSSASPARSISRSGSARSRPPRRSASTCSPSERSS